MSGRLPVAATDVTEVTAEVATSDVEPPVSRVASVHTVAVALVVDVVAAPAEGTEAAEH